MKLVRALSPAPALVTVCTPPCGGCIGSVQRALSGIDGVSRAEVSLAILGLGHPGRARPTAHDEEVLQ